MGNRKIKKINEFIDKDFLDFDYDRTEYSKSEIEKMSEENRLRVQENIEKMGVKKKKSPITIEEYNDRINKFREDGELTLTFEEINKTHIALFGCPYIEPKNNSNE